MHTINRSQHNTMTPPLRGAVKQQKRNTPLKTRWVDPPETSCACATCACTNTSCECCHMTTCSTEWPDLSGKDSRTPPPLDHNRRGLLKRRSRPIYPSTDLAHVYDYPCDQPSIATLGRSDRHGDCYQTPPESDWNQQNNCRGSLCMI